MISNFVLHKIKSYLYTDERCTYFGTSYCWKMKMVKRRPIRTRSLLGPFQSRNMCAPRFRRKKKKKKTTKQGNEQANHEWKMMVDVRYTIN